VAGTGVGDQGGVEEVSVREIGNWECLVRQAVVLQSIFSYKFRCLLKVEDYTLSGGALGPKGGYARSHLG
jgi:hypothetical protein